MAIQQCLADVQMYRKQWQHYLSTDLYVLEIQLSNRTIYKIGQTTRPIAERMAEIWADVAAIEPVIGIKVIDVFPQRGHVEWYCKHRLNAYRVELGTFTEYFSFAEDWISVRRELRRMPKKVLSSIEQAVLNGEPSPAMKRRAIEERRRAGITRGLAKAKAQGVVIGRPKGTGKKSDALLRDYWTVARMLQEGLSVRATARYQRVAINTVRKVKAALEQKNNR